MRASRLRKIHKQKSIGPNGRGATFRYPDPLPGAPTRTFDHHRVNEVPAWELSEEPGWGSAIARVAVFA